MTIKSVITAFIFSAFLICAHHAQAMPIYNVDDGLLKSIEQVDINGSFYDVTFKDGVFEDLFNIANPFTFDGAGANLASQALSLNILDVPEGDFDTNPLLIFGCASDNCSIRTPYLHAAGFISSQDFRNAAQELDDERTSGDFLASLDSTNQNIVFADWTPSRNVVPEPASILLIATGLGGMGLFRKKS